MLLLYGDKDSICSKLHSEQLGPTNKLDMPLMAKGCGDKLWENYLQPVKPLRPYIIVVFCHNKYITSFSHSYHFLCLSFSDSKVSYCLPFQNFLPVTLESSISFLSVSSTSLHWGQTVRLIPPFLTYLIIRMWVCLSCSPRCFQTTFLLLALIH